MTSRRPRSVSFGTALDRKAGRTADDVAGDVPADVSDDVSGGMSSDVSDDVPAQLSDESSGDVLDDVFTQYGRVRESASLRTKKVSVLVTESEHAAILAWTRRAHSVVGSSRVTASDVGRELFAEMAQNRAWTATILERLISNSQ